MRRVLPILGFLLILAGIGLTSELSEAAYLPDRRDQDLTLLCVTLVLFGGGLLLAWRSRRRAERSAVVEIPAAPRVECQTAVTRRQRPMAPRISTLPTYGYCAVMVLSLVGPFFWVIHTRVSPRGIWILTPSWTLSAARYYPARTPLVLRIDNEGRWYLNERPTVPELLKATLRAEFSRRSDWVVYLDADPDIEVQAAASAMDIIQGAHGRVVIAAPAGPPGPCARFPQRCRGPEERHADKKKNRYSRD